MAATSPGPAQCLKPDWVWGRFVCVVWAIPALRARQEVESSKGAQVRNQELVSKQQPKDK